MALGTLARLVLLPSRLGLDRQEQVADLALLHVDFACAVRELGSQCEVRSLGMSRERKTMR